MSGWGGFWVMLGLVAFGLILNSTVADLYNAWAKRERERPRG